MNQTLFLGVLFLASLSLSPAWAQSTAAGRVAGQVTDRQSAVIAGAEVVLTDSSTDTRQATLTNEVGRFLFLNVNPGIYDLTVSKVGFSQAKVVGQTVAVGVELTLNTTLEVGSTATSVEVQASAGAELQTSNATVGSTITGVALANLPNLGRDANAFLVLQPAVTPSGQVAGVGSDQNLFQLDGGNHSDDQQGGHGYTTSPGNMGIGGINVSSGIMPTPVETIEEFTVNISNQSADLNAAAGGQVQMVTKRGTNRFHGSAYDYYFGSNLGANTWLNNHTPSRGLPYTPLPSTHQNRFGASLGGPLTPTMWGGKTYFFFAYEGRRFPDVTTITRPVPTPLMRAGVIQVPDSTGRIVPYNLNPNPVTVNGVTYQPAVCPGGSCDPRGLGINPIVSEIWNKYMPLPNNAQGGDGLNTQGYLTPLPLPKTSNFAVARIDRDITPNWRFMTSYRYYKFIENTSRQVDIGGILPGDTFGTASAKTPQRQTPSYIVAGLSGVITPHLVNDFRFSYLRNAWEWISAGAPPQLPGLGGALVIGGNGANQLLPVQVDRGSGLARFWDGQDKIIRDDLSLIHGHHVFQFGGQYARYNLKHQRNDNGGSIMSAIAYQVTGGPGIAMPSNYVPSTVPANQVNNWNSLYGNVLGLVASTQLMYSRKGGELLPIGDPISSESIMRSMNLYFGDTWRVKPTLTLSYGLGYQIQLPAVEIAGNTPMIVYEDGSPLSGGEYLARRKQAGLSGSVFNPIIGAATIRNVKGNPKYPFDPVYNGLSPRVAVAWTPKFDGGLLGKLLGSGKTVIRTGYGRRQGRINGINVVQIPLEGIGLGQTVQCTGVSRTGQCLGTAGVDPSTAFRIGVDGLTAPLPAVSQTLQQPFFPGVGSNPATATAGSLDPRQKPINIDQVDFTIQRELSSKVKLEVGYIGSRYKNDQLLMNLDSVPHMTTLGGQAFSQAFANTYQALNAGQTPQAQPFFEAAMGGPNSAYCAGFGTCTSAVVSKQRTNIVSARVYDMWAALNAAPGWTLGRTMLSSNPAQLLFLYHASTLGYGNYNGAFLSMRMNDWHSLTATSNLTFGRALGTGFNGTPVDMFDVSSMYGPQSFDINWLYNLHMYYRPPLFKNQRGLLGQLVGGWGFAPLFTAQSGPPLGVATGGCQSFGEVNCAYFGARENAVLLSPHTGGNAAHYNVVSNGVAGRNGNPASGGSGINLFEDPSAVYSNFRRLTLGIDSGSPGAGPLRGLPQWNLDFAINKDVRIREGMGATLSVQFVNVLNHFQPANPGLSIDNPNGFGVINGQALPPRQIEFGLRIFF